LKKKAPSASSCTSDCPCPGAHDWGEAKRNEKAIVTANTTQGKKTKIEKTQTDHQIDSGLGRGEGRSLKFLLKLRSPEENKETRRGGK